MDMVELQLVESPEDMAELRRILENHLRYTGSPKAKEVLDDWHNSVHRFLKVMPIGYKKILQGSS
jgi:glutamate synthase domain-containing protein 3